MTKTELQQAIADLTAARELIATPDRWNENGFGFAFDARGKAVDVLSPRAIAFSLIGAVMRANGENYSALMLVIATFGRECFNHALTHADVIDVLTWAIVAGPDLVEVEG